ncbi:Protein N-terminal glutamine amidohydrolase alpha beta roll [Arabidopsis thaliana x Arabidopsis arenosa]|uniref:Protein N-terminal glutamine amidohydrolase n=1 Tax=Arabidopsis thaliana x Arabidopsis arenosa TaxID=1240361 RepID=A0A8T2ADE1_9BRAS|nr:Protein N-terminal glutamine amidohydrolase alpha beta roll [Arabidopsis thaliana x Arabidopsis arenosa]
MSSVTSELIAMDATRFQHTPYYCEENVYLLCKTLCENGVADATSSDLFVVFISNEKKQVPLWHQKASSRADGVVLWDYHVICVQRKKESDSEPLVWDLDSTLPFPSPLASYVTETIQPSFQLFADYQRFFRIVHAPLFFKHFASDRRHMKEPDGSWTAQPPPYEPIVAQDGILHNLSEYISMSGADTLSSLDAETVRAAISQKLGVVVSHTQLQDLFTKLP